MARPGSSLRQINQLRRDRLLRRGAAGTGFILAETLKQGVETFLKLPFKEEVLEKVLYRNAAALLGLEKSERKVVETPW